MAIVDTLNKLAAKGQQAINNWHKGKPVNPPAAPPPVNMEPHPFELPVPYALEEMPRTFLHLLKISPEVSPQVKQYITTWLDDFDQRLVAYMHTKYGEGVDQVMDMITRGVMNQQHNAAEANAKATETDVLAHLEAQLKEPDSDGEAEPGNGTA